MAQQQVPRAASLVVMVGLGWFFYSKWSDAKEEYVAERKTEQLKEARAAAAEESAALPPPPSPRAELPKMPLLAKDVLGQDERQVRARLTSYPLAGDEGNGWSLGNMLVEVEFKRGKAVALAVTFPADYASRAAPPDQTLEVIAWLGLASSAPWTIGGRTYVRSESAWTTPGTYVRIALDKVAAAERREHQLQVRADTAAELDDWLVKNGFEATVTVRGKDSEIIRVKYIFCGKVFLRRLGDNRDVTTALRDAGFKRLECVDGYDTRVFTTIN